MNYPKYQKYKNSGIAWLGEIPEHWEVRKLKYNALILNGFAFKSEEYKNSGIPIIRIGDLVSETSVNINGKFVSEKYLEIAQNFKVQKGDILLAMTGATIGKTSYYSLNEVSLLNQRVGLIRCFTFFDQKFLSYLLRTSNFKEFVNLECGGSAQENIGKTELNNFITQSPPKQEQTTIANFLDHKTEKIDRFIKKKKQLIELLNEQKAAIINQAVTGKNYELGIKNDELGIGNDELDKDNSKFKTHNSKFKDSGIEWLGEIPEHWEVRKLKYVAKSVLGKMLCKEDKGGYKKRFYLKSKNIQWLKADISDVEEMWFSEKEMQTYRLEKDDLVMSEGGEVGKTCLWENQLEECYIQNSAHKVTIINGGLPKFYLYLFFIYGNKGGFESIVNRVSIAHLTKDKLINIKCLVPPLKEQQQIVKHIETETKKINKTIATIQKEIALVEEYKTALIAEAVTGKIDVSNFE